MGPTATSPSRRADVKVRRPRPKQLDAVPTLHDAAGGAALGGLATLRRPTDRGRGAGGRATGGDDEGGLAESPTVTTRDAAAHAEARRIAARLQLATPRHARRRRSPLGRMVTARFDGDAGEIDVERTLEQLVSLDDLVDDDIVLRARRDRRRSVVLLVDVSGSMRGERVRMAAATAGALAGQLREDEVGVVAFWSDAAVLRRLTRRIDAGRVVDDLASIPAQGLTNVAFGLEAAGLVAAAGRGDRRVLMISDCVHNAGPDPAGVARALPRVDVLVDVSGEHDLDVARGVAHAGRGLAIPVRDHRDVAAAVSRCFGDRAAAVRR